MSPIRLLMLLVLLSAAVGCGLVAFSALQPEPPPVAQAAANVPPPVEMVGIMVANMDLPPGMLIKDADVSVRQVPPADVPEGAMVASEAVRAELRGSLLRHYVDRGKLVTRDDILRLHDRGFLAAVLSPGSRAISLAVDVVSGASGLIWPGDRVDMLLVQDVTATTDGKPGVSRVSGETIMSSVRVIAVDQQLSLAASGSATTGGSEGKVARTVVLEVTPAQAERVAVAQRLGRIALTVCPIEPSELIESKRFPIYGEDVSVALTPPREQAAGPHRATMRVFQGADMKEVTFQ